MATWSAKKTVGVSVVAVCVIAAVAAAITFGVRYANTRSDEQGRQSSVAAATHYAQQMFGFTPATVDKNIATINAALTGKAATSYRDILSGEDLATTVKTKNVSSTVSIQGAGWISGNDTSAKVLVFLNQSVTQGDSKDQRVEPSRVQYTMLRKDGTWKVSDIEIITDQTFRDKLHLGPPPAAPGQQDPNQPDSDQAGTPQLPPTSPEAPSPPAPNAPPVPTG